MPHTQMIAERLRFLEIDAGTGNEIRKAKQLIEPEIDGMLDRFYDHIFEQPELRKLFADRDAAARARAGQKSHWLKSLFNGTYDNDFFERAEQIGRAHARVGLTPNWYIGGYCYMLGQFIELVADKCADDKESAARILKSIIKAIFLDMDMVILCYLDTKDSSIRQVLRRATDFRADVATLSDGLTKTATQIQAIVDALPTESGNYPAAAPTHEESAAGNQAGNELNALVERLSEQTAQLDKRLNDLKFVDRLYIHDDVARTGILARLKARILGKQ